jgi:cytochrome P450
LEIPPFDPYDPDFYLGDPHSTYRALRRSAPVYWHERAHCWILTRAADIRRVSASPLEFSSKHVVMIGDLARRAAGTPDAGGRGLNYMDPPEHRSFRQLIIGRLTARAVAKQESMVRNVVRTTLGSVRPGERLDFAAGPASEIPAAVMTELLGLPRADAALLAGWARSLERAGAGLVTPEERMRVHLDSQAYFREQVEHRRRSPGGDFVSRLVAGRVDGRALSMQELVLYCVALMAGASQTTQSLIGACIHLSIQFPDMWRALREDRSRIGTAIEEVLRWWTPVRSMARLATRDTQIGGRTIRAGDGVLLLYHAANRDEAIWGDDGERFDPSRDARMRHLAFGYGEHLCPGHFLARLEPRVVLEELLERFARVESAGSPVFHHSTVMHGLEELPVVFG